MAARIALVLLSLGAAARVAAEGAASRSAGDEGTSLYTLFHRATPSKSGSRAWEPRARIALVDRATSLEPLLPPSVTYEGLLGHGESGSVLQEPLGGADATQVDAGFYQLLLVSGEGQEAVQRASADEGRLTSVKKCHLVSTRPQLHDELTIHLPSSSAGTRAPVAISYAVPGLVLNSDACPLPETGKYAKRWTEVTGVDTTVRVVAPIYAAEPPLRAPIPVKQDGTPDTPPPEKSFLQKYWMYLLPVLILMFIPAETEHSGSAEHDSSSNRAPPRELAAQRLK